MTEADRGRLSSADLDTYAAQRRVYIPDMVHWLRRSVNIERALQARSENLADTFHFVLHQGEQSSATDSWLV
jgi:hypothetical protein